MQYIDEKANNMFECNNSAKVNTGLSQVFHSYYTYFMSNYKYFNTFLSRVSILTRDTDIANLSVCPSVRLSVTFWYQMRTA